MLHFNRVKCFYGLLMIASLAAFVAYITKSAEIQDGEMMLDMEFKFLIVGLML